MLFDSQEQKYESMNQKIKSLEIQLENLEKEENAFLKLLNVTHEKLTAFLKDKKNFSSENWNQVVSHKQKLDEKLLREIENVRNPQKAKRAYNSLKVGSHWLHVK